MPAARPTLREGSLLTLRRPTLAYLGGILFLGVAYYAAAKIGQTLHYTASVSAIWPPAGVGIAALYLWGLRWWPGIFVGELLVNGDLLFGQHTPLPFGSLVGQQVGNMAEVVVGALLLGKLIGPRAALDRAGQVGGMLVAVATATAISATCGTLSMLAGDVIDLADVPRFWRTWFLGDTAGALVVVPLVLTWLRDPGAAVRRILTFEGVAMIASVLLLGSIAVRSEAPVLYLIFPAVIWAAFRFGPAGVSLALAINAFVTIGITAERVGVFFRQPIDDRTLGTQLYILVSVLTGLFLSTIFAERERSAVDLAESRRREGEKAIEERRRIARDLHDSVSQALFSSLLHSRAAEKALDEQSDRGDASLRRSLASISELTRRAQREMRTFIFEWGPGVVGNDLVPAFSRHASALGESSVVVSVRGPEETLPLSRATQTQLYGIGREALSNVVKHSGATAASVRVQTSPTHVLLEIEDNGRGFDPAIRRPGHYGLESMRSRAEEVGATLEIDSAEGGGTTLRVRVPVQSPVEADAERV